MGGGATANGAAAADGGTTAESGTADDEATSDGGLYADFLLLTEPPGQGESLYFQALRLGIPCNGPGAGAEPIGPTVTVGACTYTPPLGGVASPSPGCGTPNTAASAGTVTVVDTTTDASLVTYDWADGGYATDMASFAGSPWQPGDVITATATGGDVPPFSIATHALSSSSVTLPTSFPANEDLVLQWTPDPNAQTMSITLDAPRDDSIACSPPDSAGSLSIDASLLAMLSSSNVTLSIYRQAITTTSVGSASLNFSSRGSMESASVTLERAGDAGDAGGED